MRSTVHKHYLSLTRSALCVLCVCCVTPKSAIAESDRTVRGIVFDAACAAPIAGVTIQLLGTGRTTQSDAHGYFEFRTVPVGRWGLHVDRLGYRLEKPAMVEVVEGFDRMLRLALQPVPIELQSQIVRTTRRDQQFTQRIELERSRTSTAGSVADLLDEIPGLRVYGSADSPGGTRVSVGGEPPYRVAILLNGLPLSGGTDGSVDLDDIPPSALAAIEIHHGGQSALVGDAAVGGAVNLVTRQHVGDKQLQMVVRSGRDEQHAESMSYDTKHGALVLSTTLERYGRGATFGYPVANSTATRENVKSDGTRGILQLDDRSYGLSWVGYVQQSVRGAPGELQDETPQATNDNHHSRLQWHWSGYRRGARAITLCAWYERMREHYRNDPNPPGIPYDSRSVERFLGGQTRGEFAIRNTSVVLTVEARHRQLTDTDRLRPQNSIGTRGRSEYSLRGSVSHPYQFALGGATFSVQTALDAADHEAPAWTSRIDLGWQPWDGVEARAGRGRSFRRPRLTSLFWKADAWTVGNPDLRPERATEWDAGWRWVYRALTVDTRYFERTVTDIIVWDKRGVPARYQPINVDRARLYGREDYVELRLWDDLVTFSYAHVFNSSYDKSGEPNYNDNALLFSPRHTHDASIRWHKGRISAEGSGRWVSKRAVLRANTKWLALYCVFDVSTAIDVRRAKPSISARARLDNVTNEHIELLRGYPSPGRAWSFAMSVTL